METRRIRRVACLLFIVLCPALPQSCAAAAVDLPLDVAFYEAGFLYSQGAGIDREVVDELARRGGYRFTYVERPRARIWKDLARGSLAMTVSGMETAERRQFAYFIPYIAQKNMALVINPRIRDAQQLLQMQDAQLAVVRGFRHGPTYDPIVAQLMRSGRVTEVATAHNLFLMLQAGNRVDVIFSQQLFYEKELAELALQSRVTVRDWALDEAPQPLCLVLSKAHFSEQDYRRMAGIVAEMRADGSLRRIVARYVSGPTLDNALSY